MRRPGRCFKRGRSGEWMATDGIDPLVPTYCDCRDLDGFMLNVERLMASELVALSSPAVIGSALLLWARAWKQVPAASLPDDEKVLAAFAKLSVPQFGKVREEVLRGFVKCSDGRFYHKTLAVEAVNAYERKVAFQRKRSGDAERLRKWRMERRGNGVETQGETNGETRFVREGQGHKGSKSSSQERENLRVQQLQPTRLGEGHDR